MGMLPVAINNRVAVHVRDSASTPKGWQLWMGLYIDGTYVDGGSGPVVESLDDKTLTQAARDWYAARKEDA